MAQSGHARATNQCPLLALITGARAHALGGKADMTFCAAHVR